MRSRWVGRWKEGESSFEPDYAAIMIQTVIFDLGKVLVDFDYSIATNKIAERSKIRAAQFDQILLEGLLFRYEQGHITTEQFFREVCVATGFCGALEEFATSFGDIFTPIESMIQLHQALCQRGLPTYIFSNTNDLAIQHIRRRFPFFSNFTGHILSYEHGAMKPNPKLYEVVEAQSGRRGAELLYLDDRPENIETGAARGWQVILQETPEKTRKAFAELGLIS